MHILFQQWKFLLMLYYTLFHSSFLYVEFPDRHYTLHVGFQSFCIIMNIIKQYPLCYQVNVKIIRCKDCLTFPVWMVS